MQDQPPNLLHSEITGTNLPAISVSELSFALKRVVEDNFSYVRVRGELSRVTIAKSGHLYTDLKDEQAVLNAVCWKGTVQSLSITPAEGMDVVCTGRLTTYPGRSNYQLVIETMQLAGQGALLKMLEERRKKLAAEGLFDQSRKKPLPFLPKRIGVVTSPTGAVIRDILHRLADRFPRDVLLWPVQVQGQGAAEQIAAAINGFNALPDMHRPDLLIVARGGGSLEDLMPFNEEIVVRAAAASAIPLISAVGHETDTTLIDYAADKRAPTPTGAAEFAVPVKSDLYDRIIRLDARLKQAALRLTDQAAERVRRLVQALGRPERVLDIKQQRTDHAGQMLDQKMRTALERWQSRTTHSGARIVHPAQLIKLSEQKLHQTAPRLDAATSRHIKDLSADVKRLERLLETLSFKSTLQRGYAIVKNKEGAVISSTTHLRDKASISILLKDGEKKAQIKDA